MSNYYEGGRTGSGIDKFIGQGPSEGYGVMQVETRITPHERELIEKFKARKEDEETKRVLFAAFARKAPIDL